MTPFERNIENIYKEQGKIWLQSLPSRIAEIAQKWQLRDLSPVNNLSYNYVAAGFQGVQSVILKLSLEPHELMREMKALESFQDYGGVVILQHIPGAVLLKKVEPGHSLKHYYATEKICAVQIACAVAQELHKAPLPTSGAFPHMNHWLAALDKDWDIPMLLLTHARELKESLLKATVQPQRLLHGDLHHDNILKSDKGWKVIDPKGVIGYPINEVWAFVMDIEKDTKYIANFFGWNVKTVRQWYFVHVMLAACWNCEDGVSPNLFLDLAKHAYRLTLRR